MHFQMNTYETLNDGKIASVKESPLKRVSFFLTRNVLTNLLHNLMRALSSPGSSINISYSSSRSSFQISLPATQILLIRYAQLHYNHVLTYWMLFETAPQPVHERPARHQQDNSS